MHANDDEGMDPCSECRCAVPGADSDRRVWQGANLKHEHYHDVLHITADDPRATGRQHAEAGRYHGLAHHAAEREDDFNDAGDDRDCVVGRTALFDAGCT